ncbi:hypothetical protein AB0A70_29920 [Streptomyces morookaense]|uniref:hypothetical protein n=1 Tax=Streptomyces morookaense TaxID=1970 RepID=UPI0033D739B6
MAVADGLPADHRLTAEVAVTVANGPPVYPRSSAGRVPVAGQREGVAALAVRDPGVGPGEVQGGGDVVSAAVDGTQQERAAVGVVAVQVQHVGIGQLQQGIEDPVIEGIHGQAQGGCDVRAARVSGAVLLLEQGGHCLGVTVTDGHEERVFGGEHTHRG